MLPNPSIRMPRQWAFASERRRSQRFPIIAQAQYILSGVRGVRGDAVTYDISSGGVFLKTDEILPVNKTILLMIDWPVPLDDRCPLRLVIEGVTLRSNANGTAVMVGRWDFRIRSSRRQEAQ